MPTYEYRCKDCGEHLEVAQSFKDAALTECPACGGSLRKVFGSIGIAFKGSGFYKTDSRSSSSGAAKETSSDTKVDPKPIAEPKGDTKADAKTKAEAPAKGEAKAKTESTAKSA
ncbi:MAG: FmdB family zinc ribbon protein [Acidimicrobiales bacterium]